MFYYGPTTGGFMSTEKGIVIDLFNNYYFIGNTAGTCLAVDGSSGLVAFNATGVYFSSDLFIYGGFNINLDTSGGTKIGTDTSQKLSFYNSTPIVQPGATTDLGVVLSNLGLRAVGTAYPITTSGTVTFTDNNIVLSTGTGTKIGTGTTQKLSFYNATPIVRPGATTDLGVVLSNLGLRTAGTAYPVTTSGAVTLGSLTSGRVVFSGTGGLLSDDSDLTFATDTLTTTKLVITTSLTSVGGTSPAADGTYALPTSITIKSGIITAIS